MILNKTLLVIVSIAVIVAIIVLASPNLISFIQQSGNTEITLPIGSFVGYGEADSFGNYEYTFRFGGALSPHNPNLLQVWTHGNTFPKQLSVTEDVKQTAFALEVTVTEIHSEYIVVSVKRLT